MTSEILNIKNSVIESLRANFIPALNKNLVAHTEFSSKIKDLVLDLKFKFEDNSEGARLSPMIVKIFTSDVIKAYQKKLPGGDKAPFEEKFSSFIDGLKTATGDLPEKIIETQTDENFSTSEKTFYIKSLNNIKKAAFISYKPVFISQNFVKKIFKKKLAITIGRKRYSSKNL